MTTLKPAFFFASCQFLWISVVWLADFCVSVICYLELDIWHQASGISINPFSCRLFILIPLLKLLRIV